MGRRAPGSRNLSAPVRVKELTKTQTNMFPFPPHPRNAAPSSVKLVNNVFSLWCRRLPTSRRGLSHANAIPLANMGWLIVVIICVFRIFLLAAVLWRFVKGYQDRYQVHLLLSWFFSFPCGSPSTHKSETFARTLLSHWVALDWRRCSRIHFDVGLGICPLWYISSRNIF